MDDLFIILIRGLGSGALFSLIAMGLNIIYNASGVLNFAQGQLMIVGAVLTYLMVPAGVGPAQGNWWLSLLIIAAIVAVIAAVQGWLTLRPMTRESSQSQHSWVITTISASIIMGAVLVLLLGPRTFALHSPFGNTPMLGANIPNVYFVMIGLAILVFVILETIKRKVLFGLAINALSQDTEAARAGGMRTMQLQVTAFALSGLLMGLAGFLGGSMIQVSESEALHYVTFGFIVAVVGGIGNNLGALIAGPVFGFLLMLISYNFGGSLQLALALVVLVVVLVVRPQGVFGRPSARRV